MCRNKLCHNVWNVEFCQFQIGTSATIANAITTASYVQRIHQRYRSMYFHFIFLLSQKNLTPFYPQLYQILNMRKYFFYYSVISVKCVYTSVLKITDFIKCTFKQICICKSVIKYLNVKRYNNKIYFKRTK